MTIKDLYQIFLEFPTVSTDTRNIKKDCLFFALKGENFDGNKFAEEAIEKGAAYAIIDNPNLKENKQFIYVNDTLKTLQQLAAIHRNHFKIPLIGITGTNGKTTTKELIAAILSTNYKVLATKGNLNNHIGVPLMLLQITDETEIAIIEMGASKRGDIKELCDIANPTLGLITNIGTAHIEGFGSAENLLLTKKELFDAVIQNKGTIFYSCEQNNFRDIKYQNAITYGLSKNCVINGTVSQSNFFLQMNINYNGINIPIKTNLVGSYNSENVLAAFSVGHFFSIHPEKAINAISNYYPDNNRSQFLETSHNQIIADAYNANPSSMKAAISNFASLSSTKQKVVILGDMLELGKVSKIEHQNIINELGQYNLETIFLVGNSFFQAETDNIKFQKYKTTTELKAYLSANPLKDKLILLKGSRGIALEKIIEVL